MMTAEINLNSGNVAVQRSQGAPRQEIASARIKQCADGQVVEKWSGFTGLIQYIIACLICWFSCSMSFTEACAKGKVRLVTSQWIKEDIQPDVVRQGIRDAYNHGKFDVILALVKKGISTVLNDRGDTILRHAIQDGHTQFALQLIQADAGVNVAYQAEVDGPIEHPLEVACRKGSVEVATALLKAGADAKTAFLTLLEEEAPMRTLAQTGYDFTQLQFAQGQTALHYASRAGLVWLVNILLLSFAYNGKGNLLNNMDNRNRTALDFALQCANKASGMQVARILLQSGATAAAGLQTAMEKELDRDIVETLVRSKQNLDGLNEAGLAPIHVAAQRRDTELLALLVQNEATVDLKTADGKTALQIALEARDGTTVAILLQHGANREAIDQISLEEVLTQGDMEFFKILIDNGALAMVSAEARQDLLIKAIKADNEIAVLCLLNKGVSLDASDANGNYPLHHLAVHARPGLLRVVVELMKERGMSLDQLSERGFTALHLAVWNGRLENAAILVQAGASTSIQDSDGNTVFHAAVYRHKEILWPDHSGRVTCPLQCVVSVVSAQNIADLNIANKKEQTPLYLAVWRGDVMLVQYLVSLGVKRKSVLEAFKNRLSPEMMQALVPPPPGPAPEANKQRGFFAEFVSEFFGQA